MKLGGQKHIKHEGGATLVYVALMIFVMLGVIGLSYDLGRHYILSSELQKAADAAAVAGAASALPAAGASGPCTTCST